MKVYRYEDKYGTGPYFGKGGTDTLVGELCEAHNYDSHYPPSASMNHDVRRGRDIRCGCNSYRALRSWFKGFNGRLIKEGYKIVAYDVDPRWVSRPDVQGQVVFARGGAGAQ